jgi:hypothetical protein
LLAAAAAAASIAHLAEQWQDGDACVSSHHWHVHLAHIKAQLLSVEGLGTNLAMSKL